MNRLALLALPLALFGCPPGSLTEAPEDFSDCHAEDGHAYDITAFDSGGGELAFIEGDTLSVSVGYGGGCEEHVFAICWPDGLFLESNPVQVPLEIWHGGVADMCEAYVTETLTFDLTPLKDAWHANYGEGAGTIVVSLSGYDGELVYTFE